MTTSADNPFSAPQAETPGGMTPTPPRGSLGEIARATFLAWEKLRLIYIAVLAAWTLLLGMLGGSELFTSGRFWFVVVEGAFAANLCFFAGPVVDSYVTWLGYRGRALRPVLFGLGTAMACGLTFAVLAGLMLPGMD